jgi:uncharacterized membrane protein YgcG
MLALEIIGGIILLILAIRFGFLEIFIDIILAIFSGGSGGSSSKGFGGGDSGGGGASDDW